MFRFPTFLPIILIAAISLIMTSNTSWGCSEPVKYRTIISSNDTANSAGKYLDHPHQMIRQDRANYHRFKKRDPGDKGDPILSSAKKRAALETAVKRFFARNSIDSEEWLSLVFGEVGATVDVTFWHCQNPPRARVEVLRVEHTAPADVIKRLPPPPQ